MTDDEKEARGTTEKTGFLRKALNLSVWVVLRLGVTVSLWQMRNCDWLGKHAPAQLTRNAA